MAIIIQSYLNKLAEEARDDPENKLEDNVIITDVSSYISKISNKTVTNNLIQTFTLFKGQIPSLEFIQETVFFTNSNIEVTRDSTLNIQKNDINQIESTLSLLFIDGNV